MNRLKSCIANSMRSAVAKSATSLLLAQLLFAFVSVSNGQDTVQTKYALLVGVTDYAKPELNTGLKFPEKDAEAIGAVLRQQGYQVDLLLGDQAKREAIVQKLSQFNQRGTGVIFVGLFGHGTEFSESKTSFFCPYDTRMEVLRDKDNNAMFDNNGVPQLAYIPKSLISMDDVLIALGESNANHRILIADCCRDDPNRARGRSFGSSLTTNRLPIRTLMLLGCSAQEKSYEHDSWGHGALSKCLIDQLQIASESGNRTMGSIAEEVLPAVSSLVRNSTATEKQTPRLLSTGRVELLFARPAKTKGSWISPEEAKSRIEKCRSILDRYSSAVQNEPSTTLEYEAWCRAKLGDEHGVLASLLGNIKLEIEWLENANRHQKNPSVKIEIPDHLCESAGRTSGVFCEQRQDINHNEFKRRIIELAQRSDPESRSTIGWEKVFESTRYKEGYIRKDSFDGNFRKVDLYSWAVSLVSRDQPDDAYRVLSMLCSYPEVMELDSNDYIGEYLKFILQATGDEVDEMNKFSPTNQLLAASLEGKTEIAIQRSSVASGLCSPLAVLPFCFRKDLEGLKSVIRAKKSDYKFDDVGHALSYLLDLGDFENARKLSLEIEPEYFQNKWELIIEDRRWFYHFWEKESGNPRKELFGPVGYIPDTESSRVFAWLSGRLANDLFLETLKAKVNDPTKVRDLDTLYAMGLVEDLSLPTIRDAMK